MESASNLSQLSLYAGDTYLGTANLQADTLTTAVKTNPYQNLFTPIAKNSWESIKATSAFAYIPPMPKNIIFNAPATIVYWMDGTKTVVKTMQGDEYDPIYGVAMAYTKKIFGSNAIFKRLVKSFIPDEPEVKPETTPDVETEPAPETIGTVNDETVILEG
jgi:hypothetical protein